MAEVGRRTTLTADVMSKMMDALRSGNYMETAAQYAGVYPRTAFGWMEKGRAALELSPEQWDSRQKLYVQFVTSVEEAQAQAETRNVALIQQAATESWQAAAWWLERSRPRHYGRYYRHEITGDQDSPIKVSVEAQRTQALESLESLSSRIITGSVVDSEDSEVLNSLGGVKTVESQDPPSRQEPRNGVKTGETHSP